MKSLTVNVSSDNWQLQQTSVRGICNLLECKSAQGSLRIRALSCVGNWGGVFPVHRQAVNIRSQWDRARLLIKCGLTYRLGNGFSKPSWIQEPREITNNYYKEHFFLQCKLFEFVPTCIIVGNGSYGDRKHWESSLNEELWELSEKRRAAPHFKRLVAGFPPRRPGFKPGSSHVGFVVDNVALGQVFSEYFGFPCQSLFHQFLFSPQSPLHIIRGWYNRPVVAAVPKVPPRKCLSMMNPCLVKVNFLAAELVWPFTGAPKHKM
jgi:hypothetical protein